MTYPSASHRAACQTALENARTTIATCLARTEAACRRTRLVLAQPLQRFDSTALDLWNEILSHIAATERAAGVRVGR
jgi:hypothetical protein